MRELKQRFSIWYNHRNGNPRYFVDGAFQESGCGAYLQAMETVAAYIDLQRRALESGG